MRWRGNGAGLGVGTATSTAEGPEAIARAQAFGGDGSQAEAKASSAGGIVQAIDTSVTIPIALLGNDSDGLWAEARATVGQAAPSAPSEPHVLAAFGTGLPSDADVDAALADNLNVHANFDVGGSSTVLGLGLMGGQDDALYAETTGPFVHTLEMAVDMTTLKDGSQDLLVGLLDPVAVGEGFDSLVFQIYQEGDLVVDESFTDVAAALAFFDDTTLNLGDWTEGLSADNVLDLAFVLELDVDAADSGFLTDFMFGNSILESGPPVPIPAAFWLFGSAVLGLGVLRWRKRGTK